MKNVTFETRFVIIFLVLAFVDEMLTVQIGGVFVTPLKLFSVYCTILYLLKSNTYIFREAYKNSLRLSFTLLYLLILLYLFFEIANSGFTNFSFIERFYHFLSSLIIIDLLIKYISSGKIDFKYITKTLIILFFIEMFVSFGEVILQRPLINLGLVQLSPLKIRGFHGDRIFLSEYLTIGCFLLYLTSANRIVMVSSFLISALIIVVSGSNTGLLLLGIICFYIAMSLENRFAKTLLIALAILGSSTFSLIRSNFLSESDQLEIQKRNEMYYDDEVSANSNWRLFAISEIAAEYLKSPTIFGNGYESSSDFLEMRSNNLFKMKAHNIISTIYEYGVFGLVLSLLMIFYLIRNAGSMLFSRHRNMFTHYSFLFSILILSRFLFYYHTTIVWIYIFGIALIVYANRYQGVINKKS